MKISIAMATYNGEKYIYNQLESLKNQVRKSDEVIICDDCSTDKTVDIIKDFISNNNLNDKWKVFINEINKGYSKNFIDCVNKSSGDIIFFCDQDDIWDKYKIEEMAYIYESNANVKALSCTYKLIDENGRIFKNKFNEIEKLKGKNKLRKISFSEQINRNSSCGMILSVKRDLFLEIIPIILKNNMEFDLPIGVFAAAKGNYYILGKELAYRRMHTNNTSQPKDTLSKRFKNIDYHIQGRKGRIYNMNIYINELKNMIDNKELINLENAIKSLNKSLKNLQCRNRLSLFLDIFTLNPMINRPIAIMNFLCALFGDYNSINRENN